MRVRRIAARPLGEAGRSARADCSPVSLFPLLRRLDPSREMVMLVAMWVVGALLLVSLINANGQADRARQREIVIAQMRQASVSAPWIAFNGTGASQAEVRRQLDGLTLSLHASAARLRALGDTRESARIDGTIDGALSWTNAVVTLSEAGQLARAIAIIDRSILPGGGGNAFWSSLDSASAAYQRDADSAARRASIVSVALALVVLLAFSSALYRSMDARRRAEALSGDKQALLEQSQADATTDALTGMANRRKLFDDGARILRELPDGGSVSIGIFDLDGFKNYNDTFGHPAGDSLLAHLGHQLVEAMTGRGHAYRMGGDEFCVVTAGGDAERVLADAAEALTEHGERFSITCSYGTAAIPSEVLDLEQGLQLADRRLYGNKELTRSTQSVQIKDALIQVLEEQSGDLVRHLSRVARLAGRTAARLGMSADEISRIRLAAELHDIGKAAVPRVILEKRGPLDANELAYLRQHSVIGERILAAAPALMNIAPLVRATHERADGEGYPDGLHLAQIPMGARVIAVVDAFDAMTSVRAYQKVRPDREARAELMRASGTQFDPAVVDAFIAVLDERELATWAQFPDADEKVVRLPQLVPPEARSRAGSGRRARRS
jgi:diguanylate cyclase (GGDEF)-like protein